jgi:hypothetical protein
MFKKPLFAAFFFLAAGVFTPARSAAPESFTYQGNLWENGLPVNATKTMRFRIYDALTGGSSLWQSSNMSVPVTKGHFKVELLPTGVSWQSSTVYLEVEVEGNVISPRDTFNTVPYALTAGVNDPLAIGTLTAKSANAGITVSSSLFVTQGRVGIGTSSPGAELEVSGQIKITGGNPGFGRVLTSDANGLATWTPSLGITGSIVYDDGAEVSNSVSTFSFTGATFKVTSPSASTVEIAVSSNSIGSYHIMDSSVTLLDVDVNNFDSRYMTLANAQTVSGDKTFTGNIVLPGSTRWDSGKLGVGATGIEAKLHVADTVNQLILEDSDGSANAKKWLVNANDNVFNLKTANDAFNTFQTGFEFSRTGANLVSVVFPNGNVGVGGGEPLFTPRSTLHVPDGEYVQFEDNNAGAPPAGDCDADNERGRLSIDTTNNRLYICNGSARGWDYIALTD